MKTEALENLLIDQALGQLAPEVAALLSEHLATHPATAQSAAELGEIVALATTALHRATPKLELPPRTVIPQPRGPEMKRVVAKRLLAMAASFAVGAGAAFLAMRETSASRTVPVVQEMPAVPAIAQTPRHSPEIERALKKLPFWSKERAYLIAAAADQTNR